MRNEQASMGWQFWLQWLVATSVSWVGGTILYHTLGLALLGGVGEVAGNTILGLLIGTGQWLVLRRWLDRAGWWALAAAGGNLLAASVGVGSQAVLGENVGGLILTIGLGLVPGVLQWLVLRQQVARAGWWVLASTVLGFGAILAGVAAGFGVGLKEGELGFAIVAAITGGALYGITSGLVLIWLLRRPSVAPAGVRAEAS